MSFDYESAVWGAEPLRAGERTIAGFRLREALRPLPRRGRVLELGCGAGRFLRALSEERPELELVGIDVSRAALAELARLAPELETRLATPAAPLPAADAEFDAVLALDVLEHLDDPDAMLDEVHRVLAPGGVAHFHVPCEGDVLSPWRWLPGRAGDWKRRFGGHVQRFRRAELLALVRDAGFEVVRVKNSLHLLGGLADVAAFGRLALAHRSGAAGAPTTTGDLVARGAEARGGRRSALGGLVRAVDALLWSEATLLGSIPSWAIHVTARRC